MKHRIIIISIIICAGILSIIFISHSVSLRSQKPDAVEINRIKVAVDGAENPSNLSNDSIYDFTVISNGGEVLYTTLKKVPDMSLKAMINEALLNYDAVVDYEKDGNLAGKIIIYSGIANIKDRMPGVITESVLLFIIFVLLVLYYFYLRRYLYKPFKRLKKFANDIATGNLDLSLPMDKGNLFGEFTESFDLMREEIRSSREKALFEEKSKKELIVTLSHDLKTPVAIVRAAGELLEIEEKDEKRLNHIRTILAKTSEINRLVMDLFSSALDDLSELNVNLRSVESVSITGFIKNSDPQNKVIFKNEIPECLILSDPIRLSQVFTNIISNSYKYADTMIEVSSAIEGGFLNFSIKDFGNSLDKEEVPLIANKFYRGKNALDKEGAGLGLYICSKLLERMGGGLSVALEPDGFRVDINLALS